MFSENNEFEMYEQMHGVTLQRHAIHTYMWMVLGMFVTAVTAYFLNVTNLNLRLLIGVPFMPWIMLIAELGVVVVFCARLMKMSTATAKLLFLVYSIITGFTFSLLTYQFSMQAISTAFFVTSIYFGSLVVIGHTIHADLSKVGVIASIGLLVMIVVEVVMMFMGINTYTRLFSAIGLLLFTAFTAYDAQKMKKLYYAYQGQPSVLKNLSIYSAFELYLDFIHLFLYILRFVSNDD